jgi:hypothetical protein
MPGQAFIWDHGPTYFKPYAITAGKTISVVTEIDWTRPNIEKNFSVSIWSTLQKVTIKQSQGKASKSWYVYKP